ATVRGSKRTQRWQPERGQSPVKSLSACRRAAHSESARRVQVYESIHDVGVECPAARRDEEPQRLGRPERRAVRALTGHRIERVGEAQDASAERDLLRDELGRIAGPVPALVLRDHDARGVAEERERRKDRLTERGMPSDDLALLLGEVTRGLEHLSVDAELTDVAQQGRDVEVVPGAGID